MTACTETRDLTIDYGPGTTSVEISPTDTLSNVRTLLLDELDEDMFPGTEWGFFVNGVRITTKQEAKRVAWKYVSQQLATDSSVAVVSIRSTQKKKDRSDSGAISDTAVPQAKRPKVDDNNKTGVSAIDVATKAAEKKSDSGKLQEAMDLEHCTDGVSKTIIDLWDDDDDDEGNDGMDVIVDDSCAEELQSAFATSQKNLRIVKEMLSEKEGSDVAQILSKRHVKECTDDVEKLLRQRRPQTIIGVYGNTGVGKSSLLNALLDENSILPTSGSQGCTAAVVELSFNHALIDPELAAKECATSNDERNKNVNVPVYRAGVEFMKKEDWEKELAQLVKECSNEHGVLYSSKPNEESMAPAAAAWNKINQVYGKGTLEKFFDTTELNKKETESKPPPKEITKKGAQKVTSDAEAHAECFRRQDNERLRLTSCKPTEVAKSDAFGATSSVSYPEDGQKIPWHADRVIDHLRRDKRVSELLTAPEGFVSDYNTIWIDEGSVISGSTEAHRLAYPVASLSGKTKSIKDKWAKAFREKTDAYIYKSGQESDAQVWPLIRKVCISGPWNILSTGACLVDLPGVKDANAARAKVAGDYLEHCSNVWIVAPIKRAVDDGTARELMGEQFKRKLLMDGQYGNISFICTQTDNVEASETMRDHEEIAKKCPGRWEKMLDLVQRTKAQDRISVDRRTCENELQTTTKALKDAKKSYARATKGKDRLRLGAALEDAQKNRQKAFANLKELRMKELIANQECKIMQNELKVLCAQIRNEYSKVRLQEDFSQGLNDLYKKGRQEKKCGLANETNDPKQEGMPRIEVFCVSANDYMKIAGVKASCDGPPETFSKAKHTQIPSLRNFVHETTMQQSKGLMRSYLRSTEDVLQKFLLFSSGHKFAAPDEATASALKATVESELKQVDASVKKVSTAFEKNIQSRVKKNLLPALSSGCMKSVNTAMPVIESWGRSFAWRTYQATVRRNGQYTSKRIGAIDMNQALYDPMETEFATIWQSTMDGSIRTALQAAQTSVNGICKSLATSLSQSMTDLGVDSVTIDTLLDTATKASRTSSDLAFCEIQKTATQKQRRIARSVLPKIQNYMEPAYSAASSVARGRGIFKRMKSTMKVESTPMVAPVFSDIRSEMEKEIFELISQIRKSIYDVSELLKSNMETILSLVSDLQDVEEFDLLCEGQSFDTSDKTPLGDKLCKEIQCLIDTQNATLGTLEDEAKEMKMKN